jgi:hypothetical protein
MTPHRSSASCVARAHPLFCLLTILCLWTTTDCQNLSRSCCTMDGSLSCVSTGRGSHGALSAVWSALQVREVVVERGRASEVPARRVGRGLRRPARSELAARALNPLGQRLNHTEPAKLARVCAGGAMSQNCP